MNAPNITFWAQYMYQTKEVMKLNKAYDPNYTKSCMTLLHVTWACIALVMIADTVAVIIEAQFMSAALFSTGFKLFVLYPGVINILTMAIVHVLSVYLLKKNKFVFQAHIYLLGVTIICFVLAQSNQEMVMVFVFFIIPVVLAMFYLDTRIQISSLIFSLVGFVAHILLVFNKDGAIVEDNLFSSNVETSLVIMMIVFALSIVIIKRHEILHQNTQKEVEKSNIDELSGLPNYVVFYEDLEEVLTDAEENEDKFSLGLIDLDNFMLLNNKYKHDFGNEALKIMVDCINKSLVNTAKAYRYGEEEFVIICNDQELIMINMVDSILREFKRKTEMKLDVKVTASAGICEYEQGQFSGKRDVFAAVGEALYAAKRLGKDQYTVWNNVLVRNSFISSGELVPEHIVDEVIEESIEKVIEESFDPANEDERLDA